jgi:hypothetical protein
MREVARLASLAALLPVLFVGSAHASAARLDQALKGYFANPSDEKSYNSALAAASSVIQANSGNAACAVYAFGILQIVEGMPVFISASNKSIIFLKSSKEEMVSKVGPQSASKWDELINQAQVEYQKGLIYRGEVVGRYLGNVKKFCK